MTNPSVDVDGLDELHEAIDDATAALDDFKDAVERLEETELVVDAGLGNPAVLGVDGEVTVDADLAIERRD